MYIGFLFAQILSDLQNTFSLKLLFLCDTLKNNLACSGLELRAACLLITIHPGLQLLPINYFVFLVVLTPLYPPFSFPIMFCTSSLVGEESQSSSQ